MKLCSAVLRGNTMSDRIYATARVQQKMQSGASSRNSLLQRACAYAGGQLAQSSTPTHNQAPRFGHDFSQIPVHPEQSVMLQTKLTVNQPGDSYEQEAE